MPRIQLRENFGAIVQVEIRLPEDLKREKRVLGVHSATVAGEALVDTGSDVTAFDLGADYVAVIGRDILRHGVLVYNGKGGLGHSVAKRGLADPCRLTPGDTGQKAGFRRKNARPRSG